MAILYSFSDRLQNDEQAIKAIIKDLKARFEYIDPKTGRHFLMLLGLPTVKLDIMVMRVLHRLGLIGGESNKFIDDAVEVCSQIAELADIPVEFLDELLVKICQSEGVNLCKKENPNCGLCGLRYYCEFAEKQKYS